MPNVEEKSFHTQQLVRCLKAAAESCSKEDISKEKVQSWNGGMPADGFLHENIHIEKVGSGERCESAATRPKLFKAAAGHCKVKEEERRHKPVTMAEAYFEAA